MRYLFPLFLLFTGPGCFGQTDTTKQRIVLGVNLASILSSIDHHGITPSLTVNYGNNRFSLGGRIPFSGEGYISKEKNQHVNSVTDFQYRYEVMQRWEKIHPFVFLSVEYGSERYTLDQFYDHTLQYNYGPVFDYSFDYSLHYRFRQLNMYTGVGIDLTIWNGFYCFLSGGFGFGYGWGEQSWVESSSGNTIYWTKLNAHPWSSGNWIASGGIGFRYYPKQTREERREYRKQQRIELSSPDIR